MYVSVTMEDYEQVTPLAHQDIVGRHTGGLDVTQH